MYGANYPGGCMLPETQISIHLRTWHRNHQRSLTPREHLQAWTPCSFIAFGTLAMQLRSAKQRATRERRVHPVARWLDPTRGLLGLLISDNVLKELMQRIVFSDVPTVRA